MNDLQSRDNIGISDEHLTPQQSTHPIPTMTALDNTPTATSSYNPLPVFNNHDSSRLNICSGSSTPSSPFLVSPRDPYTAPHSPKTIRKLAEKSRFWEKARTSRWRPTNHTSLPFVVLSYNILAQTLLEIHSYLYRQSTADSLVWNTRLQKIHKEISSINPEIICLQEVQSSHLEEITALLCQAGYIGVYKQKTGFREDGCAIFYKPHLFDLIEYHSVEFLQPNVILLNRDNIGLIAKFVPRSMPNSPFIVCTTHLLYNPRRTDVRLAQMQVFLAEIDRLSYQSDGDSQAARHLPIVLTGDLNSLPHSLVTSLIASGCIDPEYIQTNLHKIAITNACQHLGVYLQRNSNTSAVDISSSMLFHSVANNSHIGSKNFPNNENYTHLFDNQFIRHNLNFTSVYDHVKENGENEASTYQDEWVTVDYMYYSSSVPGALDVLQRYRLPTVGECEQVGNIPNAHYGSDHLSLAAKFVLTDCKAESVFQNSTN